MSKSKQLPISIIQDEVSSYDEFVLIPLTYDNTEFEVKLYPLFKPEKIRDMLKDMSEFFQSAAKEKVKVSPDEESDILAYFMLKTFTDIKMTSSKKAKKIYEEYKIVINSKTMKEIIKFIPEESIAEVNQYIFEMLENSAKLERKVKEMRKQIKGLPLENREVVLGAMGLSGVDEEDTDSVDIDEGEVSE